MHPNLSPELNKALHLGTDNPQIDISKEQKGTLLEVTTRHHKFWIVVVDPATHEIALKGEVPKLSEPELWILLGAGFGGSMMKIGCIVQGGQVRARRLMGGVMETSAVTSIKKLDDPTRAQSMINLAETRRPKELASEEYEQAKKSFEQKLDAWLVKELDPEQLGRARPHIARFENLNAKSTAASLLVGANEIKKFNEALELSEKCFKDNWYFQPPPLAGDPDLMPLNSHRWASLFQRLGIKTE